MKVFNVEQGTPEWFACRSGIATASCFSNVLATIKSGESAERRNYRARLVVERLTGKTTKTFQNDAMRQGTEREPDARAAYESHTGRFVDSVGFMRHDTIEAGASPDGLIDEDGLLEIKAPELATHLEYLQSASEPSKYRAQIQGQMWISDRQWCDFVSFNPDFPPPLQLVIRRVQRDEKYIAGLALAVSLFMAEVHEEEMAVRKMAEAA